MGAGREIVSIKTPLSAKIEPKNPYFSILRREYPEPLIALLAFILGIWLWDHYFGKMNGYEPGTEVIALVKIDRDLRLSDAMAADPSWLRWMAEVDRPDITRKTALEALQKLAEAESISEKGVAAFAVIKAEQENQPALDALSQVAKGGEAPDFHLMADRLSKGRGTWWEARMLEERNARMPMGGNWQALEGKIGEQLRQRALFSRSAVWLLALVGFAFLPSTVYRMEAGFKIKPRGYANGWTAAMGLTIFLVATLAWIGFGLMLNLGISATADVPTWLGVALDSVARLLPPLIAVALIFRKPAHALKVLGVNRQLNVGMLLGLFSLLTLLDPPLKLIFGDEGASEPGGGLHAGEAGWVGLAFMLLSACVAAPIAEEVLYRGILFRSLGNRLGVAGGAWASSIIFALLHIYDGYGLASVGVFGFGCAVLYAATGSLTTVICFHMLYNLTIKLPEWIVYHCSLA